MDETIKNLKDDNFKEEIKKGVFLVDFHAIWCGPCRMLSPIIEKAAKELSGKINVAKIDIDAEQKTAAAYMVTSVPTLILFKDGKEIDRLTGLRNLEEIKKMVSQVE